MKQKISKLMASLLCIVMIIGLVPTTVFASSNNQADFANSQLSVVTDKASALAPGVTQDLYTVYDKNGDQVKMFVTTADMNVDTVEVFASYKDMDPTNYGMSKLTGQVSSFNEKAAAGDEYYQGTVVAGINASYYNMTNGKPYGAFVMNGIDVTTESEGNAYGYFAVMKDGSVKIGKPGDYSSDKGNIQEAIGIYRMLIVDGKIVSGLDSVTKYPRQTIGITADNQVVIMTADGNNAPTSIGLTIQEQAEVMLDFGCVWAGHLDGGGSATYACKPEGSDGFVVTNRPSDGSERSVSNGFIIVSTEATSYAFDHVVYEAENEYVTPGTSVAVTTTGVSSTGNAADIPSDITYETTNGTYVDGVFTAGDETGEATITAVYNGEKVGTTSINVVIPESIQFNSPEIVVPYGKSVSLDITATYGVNEVIIKPADIKFTLVDEKVGTISGFNFTACEEGDSTSSDITAALIFDETITASSKITLGRGSEVVYDFEDGTNQGVIFSEPAGTKYNYVWPESSQWVVDHSNGKVHSGNKALAMHVNYGNSLESGYMKTSVVASETRTFDNAVCIGVWLYIPDEAVGLWARWTINPVTGYNTDGTPIFGSVITSNVMDNTAGGTGIVYTFDEPGWHYLSIDTSAYEAVGWKAGNAMMQFYISDRDGSAYNYVAAEQSNIPGKFQFYLDDVTVDYSSAVDDREAPIFSNMTYAIEGMSDAAVLNKQTITTDKVTFGATVKDNTTKTNYTGIDMTSVKAYVDGVEVEYQYTNGIIIVEAESLANGLHTIKFSACDKMGNYGYVYGYINVNAENSKSTVKLVPQDETLNHILLGSIYNMDLVASAIEEVQTVEVVIDLDNNSKWELEHMTVADGFEATYIVETTENIATITITRTGDNNETGEAALVTLPVRTWELKTGYKYPNGTKQGQEAFTYAQYKTSLHEFWRMSVIATIDKGVLTRVDESVGTFTGERVFCDTEMWANYATMVATTDGKAYFDAWNGGHIHTAEGIADIAATCTKDGYTGRTFCEVCNSVVDWGTTLDATGHKYAVVDGVLKCSCDKLFNGEYEDGKTYVDGVVQGDGWSGDSYYLDGKKLTGIKNVEGYYYNFGEDGVCVGKVKYTGLFYDETVQVYRFSKLGELAGGWQQIGEDWYLFDSTTQAAVVGDYEFEQDITYQFEENGRLVSGVWKNDGNGTLYYYGPSYYTRGWQTINGDRYYFDEDGYRMEGMCLLVLSAGNPAQFFEFDENGVYIRTVEDDGLFYYNGTLYYLKQGSPYYAGLIEIDGYYYYANSSGKIATGKYWVTKNNGLMESNTYTFAEDGKMIIEAEKNGIVEENGTLYYYENGEKTYAGLIEIDGYYYYANTSGKIVTGKYWVTKNNGLMESNTYTFAEDGKMIIEAEKNGIVEENGALYYYENGEKTYAGLIQIDGYYYYANTSGKIATGKYWVTKNNGLMESNTYTFGEDGKMIIEAEKNGIIEENGALYYYENGEKTYAGLIEIDGYYYYANTSGKIATGKYWVTKNNGLMESNTYTFAEDGKMIIETVKNGIVEENGTLYYYENGEKTYAGLIEIDGYYYYANTSGKIATGKYWVTKNNGLMESNTYTFAEDGKMIIETVKNGIVNEDGTLYYYENGEKTYAGLIEIDGYYYYANTSGKIATGKYWVTKNNGLMESNTYTFAEDGKMIIE